MKIPWNYKLCFAHRFSSPQFTTAERMHHQGKHGKPILRNKHNLRSVSIFVQVEVSWYLSANCNDLSRSTRCFRFLRIFDFGSHSGSVASFGLCNHSTASVLWFLRWSIRALNAKHDIDTFSLNLKMVYTPGRIGLGIDSNSLTLQLFLSTLYGRPVTICWWLWRWTPQLEVAGSVPSAAAAVLFGRDATILLYLYLKVR